MDSLNPELSHLDEKGLPKMVDVSAKPQTDRTAEAEAVVIFPEDAYEREVNERAQYYLEEIKQRADAAKVPWNGRHEYAHRPYEAIMNIAHEQKCDLIVMGSHGRKGIDKLLLGSQTNKLLLSTDIPVLVCQ